MFILIFPGRGLNLNLLDSKPVVYQWSHSCLYKVPDRPQAKALPRSPNFPSLEMYSNRSYVFFSDWQTVLYSTSYHLYALIGFLVCLLVCLFVSLISRMFVTFKDVEPLLLHPLVRNRARCKCCQVNSSSFLNQWNIFLHFTMFCFGFFK